MYLSHPLSTYQNSMYLTEREHNRKNTNVLEEIKKAMKEFLRLHKKKKIDVSV